MASILNCVWQYPLHVAVRLYHQTHFRGEQVLLSSLLLAHHTHTQDPYSRATLCDDGSRCRGCHPSHFINHSLLRQSKLLAGQTFTPLQLVASHRRGWGRRLKRTTSSSFVLRHTSERVHSTITVGVPALISFAAYAVPIACLTHLFINLRKKRRQMRPKLKLSDVQFQF